MVVYHAANAAGYNVPILEMPTGPFRRRLVVLEDYGQNWNQRVRSTFKRMSLSI